MSSSRKGILLGILLSAILVFLDPINFNTPMKMSYVKLLIIFEIILIIYFKLKKETFLAKSRKDLAVTSLISSVVITGIYFASSELRETAIFGITPHILFFILYAIIGSIWARKDNEKVQLDNPNKKEIKILLGILIILLIPISIYYNLGHCNNMPLEAYSKAECILSELETPLEIEDCEELKNLVLYREKTAEKYDSTYIPSAIKALNSCYAKVAYDKKSTEYCELIVYPEQKQLCEVSLSEDISACSTISAVNDQLLFLTCIKSFVKDVEDCSELNDSNQKEFCEVAHSKSYFQ